MAGQEMRCEGTVWSVESDGDFLMESHGRMVFVDADEVRHDLEMGDRVTVGGIVDADEGEAPELDATTLTRLGHRVAEPK
jgi:hypothetical protein